MTFPQVKKLLTKALREAEDRALDDGVDVTTDEFKNLLLALRNELLEKMGITPI